MNCQRNINRPNLFQISRPYIPEDIILIYIKLYYYYYYYYYYIIIIPTVSVKHILHKRRHVKEILKFSKFTALNISAIP